MNKPSEEKYPAAPYAWYVVGVLFLAYVVSFIDRQILSLLIEPIKKDLQLSDTMISLLHGFAFAFLYCLAGIPIGRLVDSSNRKRIIFIGIALWSTMTSLCGFAKNAIMLFLFRMGVGVGEATLSPSAFSMIADYFPRDQRAKATSCYAMGIYAGAGLAFMFGGLISQFSNTVIMNNQELLGQFKPWQLTFIITGMLGIPIVLLMLTVKEPSRKERLQSVKGGIPFIEVIAYLWKERRIYAAIMFGPGTISVATYGLFTWGPAFFIRVYDYTPKTVGMTLGFMFLVIGTLSLFLAGWYADKQFRAGKLAIHIDIILVVSILTIVPALVLLFSNNELSALASIAIMVLFLPMQTGLVPTAFQLITPNEMRGQVIAIFLFILNIIGLGIGPVAVALITDYLFQNTLYVGKSLAIVQIISLIIGVYILQRGRLAYIKKLQNSGSEIE